MTDRRVDKIAETLKGTLSAPPEKMPLRRHADDDYVDRITVQASTGAHFHAFVRPRYKTSGLSGDEWRVSAHFEVRKHPTSEPVLARGFSRMGARSAGLVHYAAGHVYEGAPELLSSPSARLTAYRKGHILVEQLLPTFGSAVVGLAWHLVTANEGSSGAEWHHLTSEQELAHCQQVGCSDAPANFYRLKKINEAQGSGGSAMVEPPYDFVGQYTWYCARHTTRGDCGLEDADANLVLVKGDGVARPHGVDESPSGFAGTIEIK